MPSLCFNYGRVGHEKNNCPELRLNVVQGNSKHSANIVVGEVPPLVSNSNTNIKVNGDAYGGENNY